MVIAIAGQASYAHQMTDPNQDSLLNQPQHTLAALKRYFGFESFQSGQAEVIDDILAGYPTIAIMPTGAGKSLCYQLPALMLDGVTLVVSPLIALMKDQVDSLRQKGAQAEFINSSQTKEAQNAVLKSMEAGEAKLVYVAPERFRSARFMGALRRCKIDLVAIDEAHCISRWGHDFRPEYGRLGQVISQIAPRHLLACTATATGAVSPSAAAAAASRRRAPTRSGPARRSSTSATARAACAAP